MKVRTAILGAVSALALSAVPLSAALASNFSGNLSGDYANTNGGGLNANTWGASGSGVFNVASDWAIGIDAGYHNFNGSGFNSNLWNIGGNVFYHGSMGRLGAVVGYQSSDAGFFGNLHATNYGLGGEWWASNMFTVAAKGGFFNANFGINGNYYGAAITGYVMPDLALSASYDYATLNHGLGHEGDWTVQGEWLVSESTPISIYGGYQGSDISLFSTTFNTWFVGLRFYCNGDGSATLVDRQRNGTLGWAGSFSPTIAKF